MLLIDAVFSMREAPPSDNPNKKKKWSVDRLTALKAFVLVLACLIGLRLFNLQVLSYTEYKALADGTHIFFEKLYPKRGNIYLRERGNESSDQPYLLSVAGERLFPAVTDRQYQMITANPRIISDPEGMANSLAPILQLDPAELKTKLSKSEVPYVILKKKITDEQVEQIKAFDYVGLYFNKETYRFYPEKDLGGHLFGYVSNVDKTKGRYGLEGYYNDILKGREGSLEFETDVLGALIPIGEKHVTEAVDGSSLVLTIDRVVQTTTCTKLKAWVAQHHADGGSVVIMNPQTGAIIAMCSTPDFDPSEYGKVPLSSLPNPAIFTPYEPGSIFKPLTVSIGIDLGKITPDTTYNDTGELVFGPYTIRNSDRKANGIQTMTDVLDKSLNTGTAFIAKLVGVDDFKKYLKMYGFGAPTGIELDTEVGGTISSLDEQAEIYLATASFGQGITMTPLQLTSAFSTIANGGVMMQPYIVDAIIKEDGTKVKTQPKEACRVKLKNGECSGRVVSSRTAALTSGMMVTVVEKGHGKKAGVQHYYVAGKTGTAEVARSDGKGYQSGATIGSFVGFAPVSDPRFTMLVKIDRPRDVTWAESSAAPLFGDLAKFLLTYYEVPYDYTEDVPPIRQTNR